MLSAYTYKIEEMKSCSAKEPWNVRMGLSVQPMNYTLIPSKDHTFKTAFALTKFQIINKIIPTKVV